MTERGSSLTRSQLRRFVKSAGGDRQKAAKLMGDWLKETLAKASFEFTWQRYFDLLSEFPMRAPFFDDELAKAIVAAGGNLLQGEDDLRQRCEADAVFARQIYDSLRTPVTNAVGSGNSGR